MLGDNRNTNQQYFQPFLSHKLVRTAYCISGGERRNTGENRQGEESRTARNISPRRPHYRPVPPLSDTDSRTQSHTVPPHLRNTPLGSREHRALPAGRAAIEMRVLGLFNLSKTSQGRSLSEPKGHFPDLVGALLTEGGVADLLVAGGADG